MTKSNKALRSSEKTVGIKPIQWGETSYGSPEAVTISGVYRINAAMDGGWTVVAGALALRDTDGRKNFPTLEAAKAAAQADYERRILSAIEAAAAASEHRETFVIPEGHEAVRDANGRATGETRPMAPSEVTEE